MDTDISSFLNWSQDQLAQAGIFSPRLDSEIILGHTLKLSRTDLRIQSKRVLNESEKKLGKINIERRQKRERERKQQQQQQRDVLVRGIPSGIAKRGGRGNVVDVRTPRRERRRIATRERKTRIRCEIYEPLESRADDANDRGEENLRSSAKREAHEEDGGKGTRARKFLGRGRGRRGRQRVEQEQEEEDGEV